ncbi:hypothetical protein PTR13_24655 [Serratia bockelmannii]|uniref:hypothetical protein n=1 Tax=Serratia TaxID=613 RepID=UPI0011F149DF|nr:hypothetical protein [Serratia marcescens]
MRKYAYLAFAVFVVAFGYFSGTYKLLLDDAKWAAPIAFTQHDEGVHAVPASSQMMQVAQTVSDSETQSLLQEQLDVMREQLAETKVMQSRLQVMSSACEASTSVKPAGGDKHE